MPARLPWRQAAGRELNALNAPSRDRIFREPVFDGRLGPLLGQGGLSRVHDARTRDGRQVAVKLPRADAPPAARALIRREFKFLSEISHPNVVAASGLATVPHPPPSASHDPGIVMEYLGGGDLVSLAGSPPRRWAPVAALVARAVEALHGDGIVHRDLKPRNVLLGSGDAPRLIDFALAARIGERAPKGGGTAAYRRGNESGRGDAADDVYALAALVYELWFGALPFGTRPTTGARDKWRGIPEAEPNRGTHGLGRLAAVINEVLARHPAALSAGVQPLRHALESVVSKH